MSDYYEGATGTEYFRMRSARRQAWIQEIAADRFRPYIASTDTVLDYGCGTGEILARLGCARRIGIEINAPSRVEALKRGIEVFETPAEILPKSVDVVISHHALEHVPEPHAALMELKHVLRPNGRMVLVVPAEDPRGRRSRTWHPEPDRHLFSWTPLTLGNLLTECGLRVEHAAIREFGYSKWLAPIAGVPLLYPLSRHLVARFFDRYHTFCVAIRPD